MFSKAKNDTPGNDTETGLVEIGDAPETASVKKQRNEAKSRLASTSARRNNAPKAPSVPSLISSDVVINGSIQAEGELHFDGTIEGNIAAKGLFIGEGALVTGQITADQVKVAGAVDGTIRANKVELTMTSSVKGDIIHTALSIENGARFEGSCRHCENPQDEQGNQARPGEPAESAPSNVTKPRTVAAASPVAAEPEEAPAGAETQETGVVHSMAAPEENTGSQAEEAPKPPVLKSLPGTGNAPRSKSAFLNRGGKPDLR